jgi:hypothetical protein
MGDGFQAVREILLRRRENHNTGMPVWPRTHSSGFRESVLAGIDCIADLAVGPRFAHGRTSASAAT